MRSRPACAAADRGRSRTRPLLALALLLAATHAASAEEGAPPAGGGPAAQAGAMRSGTGAESHDAAAPTGGAGNNGTSRAAMDRGAAAGSRAVRAPKGAPTTHAGSATPNAAGHPSRERDGANNAGAAADTVNIGLPSRRRLPGVSIRDRLAKPPAVPGASTHVHQRPSGVTAAPARNAIGMAVGNATRIEATEPPRSTTLAPAATVMPRNTAEGAVSMGSVRPLPMHQNAAVPTAIVPHQTGINGTGMTRIGTGPATIGGPTRTANGINGTNFKARHGN